MAKARIERYRGAPAILIDGVPYPPMTLTTIQEDPEYLKKLRESGIRIFYLTTAMRWNRPGTESEPDGVTDTLRRMQQLLDIVPDAYIMFRLNVNPSVEWINAHPEEQVLFNDGSHEPVICTSAGKEPLDGMISFASGKWRAEGKQAIEDYLAEMEQSPLFDRVIGFFLCAGGTDEWYYPGEARLDNEKKGTYADFSAPFQKSYSEFLRKKYGTEENLRRAWNKPDATFDRPQIPTIEERVHIRNADDSMVKALANWEFVGQVLGAGVDFDAKSPANVGVFLNADRCLYTADFYDALHHATADTIVHFGTVLKNHNPDLLVGAFYGSCGCTAYYEASTCSGTLSILDSGVVDFLAAPGVYNNREPGGVVALREMQDSFRLRNQIFINEDDSRTHLCLPLIQRQTMALYTPQDSVNTLKRDFARDICEDIQGWWLDMSIPPAKGWYDDPDILALFKRQQEIGQLAYSIDRTKKNEIALIYDTESVLMVSDSTDKLVLDFFRTSDLARIGAPVDYYFHNDLARADMPDYKLYVMLNQYCLTDEEREAIHAKARKNHATVLWLYAPGFVNFQASPVMSLKNMEKAVGMKLKIFNRTIFPWFRVDPSAHPAVRFARPEQRYGYIDRHVHSNIWVTPSVLPPVYTNPGFAIQEDKAVTVLGRYCLDGEVAYAMREDMGFVSAYCCTQVIRSELIASLAEYSGCHLYTQSDDVLYANQNFVAIHASYTGTRRITFPQRCSPYELYEKRYYGHNVSYLDLDLKLGETRMFQILQES